MRFEFRPIATPIATLARHARHGLFIAAALSGALAQAAPLPLDMATTSEQRFQLALEAQTAGDYASMLALLRQAARDGEPQAQETLAWILLAGPTLYGT
ncbi:sel1 repeat family protein, partial [Delftia tsuruhatensis]